LKNDNIMLLLIILSGSDKRWVKHIVFVITYSIIRIVDTRYINISNHIVRAL